jgi:hypothetical protein
MSTPMSEAGQRLLDELRESPLLGALYARDVVSLRLPAIEAEARTENAVTIATLRAALEETRAAVVTLAQWDCSIGRSGVSVVATATALRALRPLPRAEGITAGGTPRRRRPGDEA